MEKKFEEILQEYETFREKYADSDTSILRHLSDNGQQPQIMVVACCDSRVDPALLLQCDPGDLFVVRNVANIVPPYEKDEMHHGTSAALEFGICKLGVKDLVLLGHSQCGGINALLNNGKEPDDFITNWMSIVNSPDLQLLNADDCARIALKQSYNNCLSFPWIRQKLKENELNIHLWFFDIKTGQIFTYCKNSDEYQPLRVNTLQQV